MLDVLLEIVIRVMCCPAGWAFIKIVISGRRPDRAVRCADTPETSPSPSGAHNIKGESQPRSGKETAATDQSGGGEQAFLFGDVSRQCVHQVWGQAIIGFQAD